MAKQGLDGGDEYKQAAEVQEAMCAMLPGKLAGFVRDLKDSLMPDIENERLEAQPAKRQEKDEHDFALKAATSKVHQVVKLQNGGGLI